MRCSNEYKYDLRSQIRARFDFGGHFLSMDDN